MIRFNFSIINLQSKYKQLKYGLAFKSSQQRKLKYSVKLYYKSSFFTVVTRRNTASLLLGGLTTFTGAIQSNTVPLQELTLVALITCSSSSRVPIIQRLSSSSGTFQQFHPITQGKFRFPHSSSWNKHTPERVCVLTWLSWPGSIRGSSSWPTNLCMETAPLQANGENREGLLEFTRFPQQPKVSS